MDKNRVSIDQLALILLLVITGGKFLSLPSLLARDLGHDSWLSMCFSFTWDAVGIVFLLWAVKLNGKAGLDISAILNNSVSKPIAKVILAVFFVIFVVRADILLISCYRMFSETFDVSTNWVVYVVPIALLGFFVIEKGFNSIARTSQLLFGLIIISVVTLLASPLTEVEFGNLLPIAEAGWDKVLSVSFKRSFWFSDYIFIFFVMDGVKVKKRVFSPILLSFVIGAALSVLLNAVFVALFGVFAPSFDMAMSKIGVFSVASTANGRWDWLTLSIWLVSVIIKIVVFIFCAYKCLEKIAGKNFAHVNWLSAVIIVAALLLPMFVSAEQLLNTVVAYGLIPFAAVQYVLPVLMPLLTKTALRKTEVQHE